MRIPSKFKLANRTWKVKFVKRMKAHGETSFDKATIRLNEKLLDDMELLDHTFVHEMLHAASGTMGWSAVNDNEEKIDVLAGLLAQAINTMEIP